jgi:hypothetical protein
LRSSFSKASVANGNKDDKVPQELPSATSVIDAMLWSQADTALLMQWGPDEYLSSGERLEHALLGLQAWRKALAAGRLPEFARSGAEAEIGQATHPVWPAEPLFSRYVRALQELEMPKFTARHPQLIDSVLRALVDLVTDFYDATNGLTNGRSLRNRGGHLRPLPAVREGPPRISD